MTSIEKEIQSTTSTFMALLTLGLIGLLFLIVFGNLSGNLGFTDDSTTITNESSNYAINATTYTLAGTVVDSFVSVSVSAVNNATDGKPIGSGNYTVSALAGTITGSAGRSFNWTDVNITYSVTTLSDGGRDTTQVIENLTAGNVSFFSFSNVWFTLLAVVLLIIIVMSVIGVVNTSKKSNFSS